MLEGQRTELRPVNLDQEYEIAKLLCDRGDLLEAAKKLETLTPILLREKNYELYLKSQNQLLRIYAETENEVKINQTKEKLQDLVIQEGFNLNSKTYYTLGICAAYKKQGTTALEYFEKALNLGLKNDCREDICFAISGLAGAYWVLGRYEEALKEIYNLQVFFQVMPIPEIELYVLLLNGMILRKLGKYEPALEVYWQAYDKIKKSKNLFMYLSLMNSMGSTYADMGDKDLAKVYLNLAKKSIDPNNLVRLAKQIDTRLEELGDVESSNYDLVLDTSTNAVIERKKGKVDFKSQFILLDLLKLFMLKPGEVHSKEALVEKVWKQEYNPAVHDNKVYVTIKRLRKLIEPDYDKPRYIFRSKNGYYLNRNSRVKLSH
ncbi:MAG: winged helix-turn-helix domain-containing protein [Bdellovibrionales bacterium]|nr:winged helix-turn-helix domain-containing protein [Bdellovibrionales bacterium]